MTASQTSRSSLPASPVTSRVVTSAPMSHQNSGDHGHEMYPQQFIRLVGSRAPHAPVLRVKDDAKLH